MSTKVNAERVAAGLIVRESAQLLKQMKLWFEYDSRIKVQRTRYKELLLAILRLASGSIGGAKATVSGSAAGQTHLVNKPQFLKIIANAINTLRLLEITFIHIA